MKIIFNDGSFLEFIKNKDTITLVICGFKSKQQLTMSSVTLTIDQSKEMLDYITQFLQDSKEKENV